MAQLFSKQIDGRLKIPPVLNLLKIAFPEGVVFFSGELLHPAVHPLRTLRRIRFIRYRLSQSQHGPGGQIHETAFRLVLVGPVNGLKLRGIDRQGIQDGPYRRFMGISQNGCGEPGLRMTQPVHLLIEIGRSLYQNQLRTAGIQSLPQAEGRRRGQMPYPEKDRTVHHGSSSRQARYSGSQPLPRFFITFSRYSFQARRSFSSSLMTAP